MWIVDRNVKGKPIKYLQILNKNKDFHDLNVGKCFLIIRSNLRTIHKKIDELK